jgi:uracil-DNA glycosylase
MTKAELNTDWVDKLNKELSSSYYADLELFVKKERTNYPVFPKEEEVFNALQITPLEKVKVVILGQDPYHGPNQAHGLSFSVNKGIKSPPSLVNIFKELSADLGVPIPNHGNLTHWAKQGVLLLNATLTVRAGTPGSHQNKGWEKFTDKIIQLISDEKEHCVFLLWGNYAKSKLPLINQSKHLVLTAAHPSPLARGAFFGSRHFSKTNAYLKANHIEIINWDLTGGDL